MGVWGVLGILGIVLWFGSELPDLEEIAQIPKRPNITLLDKHGQRYANYGDFYGRPIRAQELPAHVIHALIATEDRRFFSHFGIDPIGLVRAIHKNMEAKGVVQGGSTITQQLAKNFLQSKKMFGIYDRSIRRKILEALLAFMIERRFTKEEILSMYLNRVYMGSGTYGLDAAALRYFGKHATELGLYESAVIMGLLRAPSRYSPASNLERSESRAKQVLTAMVEEKLISTEAAQAAMAMPTPLDESLSHQEARHFADWVVDVLHETVDIGEQDVEVITTIDLSLQKIAEYQTRKVLATRGLECGAEQAALLAIKPDGAIQAMVGGLSYTHSKFNRATQALRQTGSVFKFFVYLAALEDGFDPYSTISDRPIELSGWKAKNFKYKSRGQIPLIEALTWSVNAVSVRLAMILGVKKIIRLARELGISSELPKNYTIALGTGSATLLEMTGAFASVAHEGCRVNPYGILKVRTMDGTVLYKHAPSEEIQILSDDSVKEMRQMMAAVMDHGTGRNANIPEVLCLGKTGTTQNNKDSWLIAMTPHLVTGVWSGCDHEKPMRYLKGGSSSVFLWKGFNQHVLRYLQNPQKALAELESLNLPSINKNGVFEPLTEAAIIKQGLDQEGKKKQDVAEDTDNDETEGADDLSDNEEEDDDNEEDEEEDDEDNIVKQREKNSLVKQSSKTKAQNTNTVSSESSEAMPSAVKIGNNTPSVTSLPTDLSLQASEQIDHALNNLEPNSENF